MHHSPERELEMVPVGELPPLGIIPKKMHAQVIRESRYGKPETAFQAEVVEVPEIGPHEALIAVMAAGINHNNIWAAQGFPVNVIANRLRAGEKEAFHIGGSDGAGIVYKVGSAVTNVQIGDQVVIHCMQWDQDDEHLQAGGDPLFAPSCKVWGFETNWGSFAQFAKVQARQCLPKPKHLSWSESASYLLCGLTVYRMLNHWSPNRLERGGIVLIWGGAGGLGVMAIQLTRLMGGIPVAVVSSDEKGAKCVALGCAGFINRKQYTHWGPIGDEINDNESFQAWARQVQNFGRAIWDITGKGRNPDIVLEHPGQSTMPTSLFVCKPGGMVVTCAGTSGFAGSLDLRFLWMRSKRLQGSHAGDDSEALAFNQLIMNKQIDPCLSESFSFEEVGSCHQMMVENRHPPGNMVILIGAT